MIALTLGQIEYLKSLIEEDERLYRDADVAVIGILQIKSILQAERRSLEQAMGGGDMDMPKAAKKKVVAKSSKPVAKKKAK